MRGRRLNARAGHSLADENLATTGPVTQPLRELEHGPDGAIVESLVEAELPERTRTAAVHRSCFYGNDRPVRDDLQSVR